MSINKQNIDLKSDCSNCLTKFYICNGQIKGERGFKVDDDEESTSVKPGNYDFNTVYMWGDKKSGLRTRSEVQNYAELLDYHIQKGTLFEDNTFSPSNIILTDIKGEIVWKRPPEVVENPQFIIEGTERFDVEQGGLGDCWFLAAIANLTTRKTLLEPIIPRGQNFSDKYAGIFHFRFWQFGKWVDIVIDDRLPTIDNKLIYLRSENVNEFWTALMEKAYAKLYGSYKNIEGGQISEALEDMTGGLSEFYETRHSHISDIMLMSYERASFMGCSIMSTKLEEKRKDGLVTRHAYSITKIITVEVQNEKTNLVRVRNPWGDEVEWNGPWSDNSENWYLLPKEVREKINKKDDDGEFWMELNDFQNAFTYLDICHLTPTSFAYLNESNKKWNVSIFEGVWLPNVTAGGGIKYLDTISNNPQYFITISGSDINKEYVVVVGLMQKHRRFLGVDNLPIELALYQVPANISAEDEKLLKRDFFELNHPISYLEYTGFRQLTGRFHLPVGRYCIIPCTSIPNLSGEYLLRVFSEINNNMIENDEEIAYSSIEDEPKEQALKRISITYEKTFNRIAGREKEIGWDKICKVLNKVYNKQAMLCFLKPKKTFSKETCRNIVALWDKNCSGTLDYDEFWKLITDVATLEIIFKKFDENKSGKLNGFELRNLLQNCGYKVNRQILHIIMVRYGVNGSLTFENFVICVFKLKTILEEFHNSSQSNEQKINLSKNEWLEKTLLI